MVLADDFEPDRHAQRPPQDRQDVFGEPAQSVGVRGPLLVHRTHEQDAFPAFERRLRWRGTQRVAEHLHVGNAAFGKHAPFGGGDGEHDVGAARQRHLLRQQAFRLRSRHRRSGRLQPQRFARGQNRLGVVDQLCVAAQRRVGAADLDEFLQVVRPAHHDRVVESAPLPQERGELGRIAIGQHLDLGRQRGAHAGMRTRQTAASETR